jgi:uncharacterized protein
MLTPDFTPIPSLIGGLMIGAASVLLMLTTGRIAGVSGFVSRLLPPYLDDQFSARVAFVAGLIVAPPLYSWLTASTVTHAVTDNHLLLIGAGLLVGFGSIYGSGCTSGHGVCGLARRSSRSLVATAVFMLAGIITVYIARHGIGS